MKTLILVLFLLFSGVVQSQTFQVDSIAHYPDFNKKAYSTKPREGNINLDKNIVTFDVDTFKFKVRIVDTLETILYSDLSYVTGFKVIEVKRPLISKLFTIYYVNGEVTALAITNGKQLDIFHVIGEYINTIGRLKKNHNEKSNIYTIFDNYRISCSLPWNERMRQSKNGRTAINYRQFNPSQSKAR